MTSYPKIQLSRLREIGWTLWDPIGLADKSGSYPADCADEYDTYLLHVVSMLCRNGKEEDATNYLVGIASDYMGLSVADLDAAAATTRAIADYLTSLPDGPKGIRLSRA